LVVCAAVIYPDNAAAVLPDVDTQKGNMHGSAPSLQEKDIILDVPGRAGQPITNGARWGWFSRLLKFYGVIVNTVERDFFVKKRYNARIGRLERAL
jgi:hypothetical protein